MINFDKKFYKNLAFHAYTFTGPERCQIMDRFINSLHDIMSFLIANFKRKFNQISWRLVFLLIFSTVLGLRRPPVFTPPVPTEFPINTFPLTEDQHHALEAWNNF